MLLFFLLVVSLGLASTTNTLAPSPSTNGSFTKQEIKLMKQFLNNNINLNGSGGISASPDMSTRAGVSYFYDWTRVSGITYNALLDLTTDSTALVDLFRRFIQWIQYVQIVSDPFGIDPRGEPKFFLPSGEVFLGANECRPQYDGVGLRSAALGKFVQLLITQGEEDYAKDYVWPLMQKDCQFIIQMWQQYDGCNVWAENRGRFFYTLMVQRKGLLVCSMVAKKLGFLPLSIEYNYVAGLVQGNASKFWNGAFISDQVNITQPDSAVLFGVLYGYNGDDFLAPTDVKVVSTIAELNKTFAAEFPINSKDDLSGVPGILLGRYKQDSYLGGNPSVYTTAVLAELYFQQATMIREASTRGIYLTEELKAAFAPLTGKWLQAAPSTAETSEQLAAQLTSLGDGVLQRIRYHVSPLGFHLPEQLDRSNGSFANAHDLTWSYVSVLSALHVRGSA